MRTSIVAASILMLMVVILSIQPYQMVYAQSDAQLENIALSYVENVLPFNMSHYTITVGNAYSLPSGPNDATITQAVDIDLNSGDSTIHVVCLFVNGVLHQCGVRPAGTPVADGTYGSVKEVATRILQAHQQQTGLDSTILINTLDLVNDTEITSVTLGNVSLSISHFPDIIGARTVNGMPVPITSNSSFSTDFHWILLKNGITEGQVTLSFNKGVFYNLQDERAIPPTVNKISDGNEQQTDTPTPAPIAATHENLTSLTTISPQSKNDTSTQSNQFFSQKTLDSQNELGIPILIAAVAAYMIVVLLIITYKHKNQVNQIKSEVSKRD